MPVSEEQKIENYKKAFNDVVNWLDVSVSLPLLKEKINELEEIEKTKDIKKPKPKVYKRTLLNRKLSKKQSPKSLTTEDIRDILRYECDVYLRCMCRFMICDQRMLLEKACRSLFEIINGRPLKEPLVFCKDENGDRWMEEIPYRKKEAV